MLEHGVDGQLATSDEDLRNSANASLMEAVFMITRGAGAHDYSFYGSSTGN